MFKEIRTNREAIKQLGGPAYVSRMFDPRLKAKTVESWGGKGRALPAKAYCVLAQALIDQGCRFDPERLFGMLKPGGADGQGRRAKGNA